MAIDTAQNALTPERILRNVFSNYTGKFIALATGFLLTPFIVRRLGASDYGLWVLAGSVVAYISLLDFGISGAVIKYVAEHRAKGDIEQAHHLLATALCVYCLLGLAAFGASALIALVFPTLFHMPDDQRALATWLMLLMGLRLGLAIPCTTTSAVLVGLQRYDIANAIGSLASLLSAVAIVLVLLSGGGVLGLAIVDIPIRLLMQVPAIWAITRIAPTLRFGWRGAQRSQVRRVLSFSTALFVENVSWQVQTKTDEIVIGAYLSVRAVTPYSLARSLSTLAQMLTEQFISVLMPMASELDAENDRSRLQSLYLTGTRLTVALSLSVGLVVAVLAGPILSLWVGEAFAEYAPLVVILTAASVIDTSQWPAGSVLQGMARHRPLAAAAVVSATANLGLSLLWIKGMGLAGVALGTLIPTAVVCLGLVQPYALKVIGIGAAQAFREILVPALLPMLPAALILLLLERTINPPTWPALIAVGGATVVAYAAGYLTVGASHTERGAYKALMRSAFQLLSKRHAPTQTVETIEEQDA